MKPQQRLRHMVLATATAAVLMACQPSPDAQSTANPPTAPKISVAQVISERITEWDEFTGRLEAPQTVALRPRISGYIDEVVFKEGALVSVGDVLFVIDAKPFQAQVNKLTAELADAQSQVELAQRELTRGRQLKNQNAISQEALDNRVARQQQARAAVQSRQAALEQAQLDLDYTRVKAPISGRISRAMITRGNYVTAGQSQLTTLVSTDKMYAYFDADEQSYLKYNQLAREGIPVSAQGSQSPVLMALANDTGFPHTGHIDFIDNQLNQATGTMRGRAVFDNSDGRFTPGLFARIKLMGSASYDGILIDDRAVGTDLNNKFVLVLDTENKVQYRGVTLGKKHNCLRLITSGLQAGDSIVVNGLQRVRPGAAVDPVPVAMASDKTLKGLHALQRRVDELQTPVVAAVNPAVADKRS